LFIFKCYNVKGMLDYVISNIPLVCVSTILLFISIRDFKIRKRESILFIVFTLIFLFVSFVVWMETHSQKVGNVVTGTIFTSLGYIIRPIGLYIFILLALQDNEYKFPLKKYLVIPLFINLIVYILPLFMNWEGVNKLVFYYELNPDGTASFIRGTFLNYTSHAFSVLYIVVLVITSLQRFNGKHKRDAFVLFFCAGFITLSVVAEMLTRRNDILNNIGVICALINYIFLRSINSAQDTLTHLYDRQTFYEDVTRYRYKINGVIQIDMNGLKYLNDNFGHDEGDKALSAISQVFLESINKKSMYVYRLSGDEFLIMMINGTKDELEKTVMNIKEKLQNTNYAVALGTYFISQDDMTTVEEALKIAEKAMYEDKKKYYIETGKERRQA